MSEELVKINPLDEQIAQGGVGIDFGSKIFKLKPSTLSVNQGMTQAEGAIPGKFRVVETGEQFDRMTVAMLFAPKEARQYYMKQPGEKLVKTPDRLTCFAVEPPRGQAWRPHENSKIIQALACSGCGHNDSIHENWKVWNDNKIPENKPQCERQWKAMFIDTITQLPLRCYLNGGSRKNFEEGMERFAAKVKLLQSQGIYPNIWDIQFDIFVTKNKSGDYTTYALKIDPMSFKLVTEAQKEVFGGIYKDFISRNQDVLPDVEETIQADAAVDAAVENEQGEIVI